ncbi:hypothetical protein [Vibrio phage vB_VpM-pA2SJ1]|uniref:Uncharacterized protein n=1 Tax=Vibrio phage vB_VpM-pA2SJ1 TaxID=3095964 RepID=A0AAX4J5A6_9CAUD
MNNSQIFSKAHAIAKECLNLFVSYRGAFSFALRTIYAELRAHKAEKEQVKEPAKEEKPFIAKLWEAYEPTTKYSRDCWWLNKDIESVLRKGQEMGLVSRRSTTQVALTSEGAKQVKSYYGWN